MAKLYSIKVGHTDAKLYLVWEYGHKRGREIYRKLTRLYGGVLIPSDLYGHLKRDAIQHAERVIGVAGWQRGRLGYQLQALTSEIVGE